MLSCMFMCGLVSACVTYVIFFSVFLISNGVLSNLLSLILNALFISYSSLLFKFAFIIIFKIIFPLQSLYIYLLISKFKLNRKTAIRR